MEPKEFLKGFAAECAVLAEGGSRIVVKTEEGRILLNLLTRVIETLADGTPTTKPSSRHHE